MTLYSYSGETDVSQVNYATGLPQEPKCPLQTSHAQQFYGKPMSVRSLRQYILWCVANKANAFFDLEPADPANEQGWQDIAASLNLAAALLAAAGSRLLLSCDGVCEGWWEPNGAALTSYVTCNAIEVYRNDGGFKDFLGWEQLQISRAKAINAVRTKPLMVRVMNQGLTTEQAAAYLGTITTYYKPDFIDVYSFNTVNPDGSGPLAPYDPVGDTVLAEILARAA